MKMTKVDEIINGLLKIISGQASIVTQMTTIIWQLTQGIEEEEAGQGSITGALGEIGDWPP